MTSFVGVHPLFIFGGKNMEKTVENKKPKYDEKGIRIESEEEIRNWEKI